MAQSSKLFIFIKALHCIFSTEPCMMCVHIILLEAQSCSFTFLKKLRCIFCTDPSLICAYTNSCSTRSSALGWKLPHKSKIRCVLKS